MLICSHANLTSMSFLLKGWTHCMQAVGCKSKCNEYMEAAQVDGNVMHHLGIYLD
jgi:hypothetical protein